MDHLSREKLETLDGSRGTGAGQRKAAVRIEDISALLELPKKLKSAKAAGAAPTKAEYDALVDDVTALFNRLTAVAQALQKRILP